MAEALKDRYGPEVVRGVAASIAAVFPAFAAAAFEADALDGYDTLSLMARVRRIADAMHRHLPPDYPRAVGILLAALEAARGGARRAAGVPSAAGASPTAGEPGAPGTWSAFAWLPHTFYVASHGLDPAHFELSMRAQHALTRACTAEFSLRAFLERHPERTLATLRAWTADPDEHVRRLVSEGTRPRLPWAARLPAFQRDPAPVLALLERLRDDPAEYVRRSVANNLNDIGKDHPDRLLETCARWLADAPAPRRALVRHALRTLTRRGDPRALALLGHGEPPALALEGLRLAPASAAIGGEVRVAFALREAAGQAQSLMLDLRVHYRKADGSARPRVFPPGAVAPGPGERREFGRRLSLRQMSTRTHHPGEHRVEVVANGAVLGAAAFALRAAQATDQSR